MTPGANRVRATMVANIMLALHCKKTEAIDLKSPIWEYISNTYSVDQV